MRKISLVILLFCLFFTTEAQLVKGGRVRHAASSGPDYSAYNQNTQNYLNAMSNPWTGDTIAEIDYMIDSLDNDGYLDSIPAFYMFASTSSGDALINIANPGTYNADLAGTSPTFTRLRYVQGDAVDDVISTNFNPTTEDIQQDAIAYGIGIADNQQYQDYVFGTSGLADRFRVRGTADATRLHINTTANNSSYSHTNSIGHWYVARTDASTQKHFLNGVEVDTEADASQLIVDAEFTIFTAGTEGHVDYQVVFWFAFRGVMTEAISADIQEDIEAFLDYIGGGIE
jgi:hypothetical protein